MIINELNYVDEAEKVIKTLAHETNKAGRPVGIVTTSKIRNLLAMTADIYNEVLNTREESLGSEIVSRIQYLKIRFVYEAGREPKVGKLVSEAKLIEIISQIGNSKTNYILFSRYMEALVAFRKYYGGKDE